MALAIAANIGLLWGAQAINQDRGNVPAPRKYDHVIVLRLCHCHTIELPVFTALG